MLKFLEKLKTVILILVLLASIVFIAIYFIGNKRTQEINSDLMTIHDIPTKESVIELNNDYKTNAIVPEIILESMKQLIERNEDTVGWIKIDGLPIDNVVVQGDDNQYYLTRDFDNNYAEAGTLFLDEYCSINPTIGCDNIVIYGHNQMDGSMFGSLTQYKKSPLLIETCPYIEFNNNYHNFKFKIFSMFIINTKSSQDDEALFPYHMYSRFDDEYKYETFEKEVLRRSLVNTSIDINENDTFITLSTCAVDFDEARFVIVGRAIRDEEDFETEETYSINQMAYLPDIYYELNCDSFQY